MKWKIALFSCCLFTLRLDAVVIRDDVPMSRYQALAIEPQFSACGCTLTAFFNNQDCTATLLNPRTALIAAHCLVTDEDCVQPACTPIDPTQYLFSLGQNCQLPTDLAICSAVIVHSLYNGSDCCAANDIGLIALQRRIPYLSFPPLASSGHVGEVLTLVGYGNTGTGSTGEVPSAAGIKTAANNVIDGEIIVTGQTSQQTLVCDFDCPSSCPSCQCATVCPAGGCNTDWTLQMLTSDSEPLPLEGISGHGDSGGPIFVHSEGTWQVTGVVSAGYVAGPLTGNSVYGSIDIYTPAHLFLNWIASNNPLRSVTWTGSSGVWSTASSWSEGEVPNNLEVPAMNQARYYEVSLQSPVTITADTSFTVDAITLNHSLATLLIPAAQTPLAYETHLEAGTLQVDGTLSSSFTLHAGTLVGSGHLIAILPYVSQPTQPPTGPAPIPLFSLPPVLNAGATLIPGGSTTPGTLHITGDYTQTGGTLLINIGNQENSLLQISGQSALNGTLKVVGLPLFSFSPETKLTVLEAQSVSGSFAQVMREDLPFLVPIANYLSDRVEIFFIPTPDTYISSIQSPLFNSVNEINTRLRRQMEKMHRNQKSRQTAPISFSSLERASRGSDCVSPLFSPRKREKTLAAQIAHLDLALFKQPKQNGNLPKKEAAELAEPVEIVMGKEKKGDFYVGPIGSLGKVETQGTQIGLQYTSLGVFSGFDYAMDWGGVGLYTEYERTFGSGHKNWGQFSIDQVQASLYSALFFPSLPRFLMGGAIGASSAWFSVQRNTGLPLSPQVARGNPQGYTWDALWGAEYILSRQAGLCRLECVPMLYLQYLQAHIQSYREKGAGFFDLNVQSQNPYSLCSLLGARGNCSLTWQNVAMRWEIDLLWQHEFLDPSQTLYFTPLKTTPIPTSTTTFGRGKNLFVVGLDLLLVLSQKCEIEMSYDLDLNSHLIGHSLYLSLGGKF